MKIEIDLRLLEQNHLSPDDFVFIYTVWRKAFGYLNGIPLRVNGPRLETDGWIVIKNTDAGEEYFVQQKFKDLYVGDFDKMFEELVELYPFKVMSPGRGERILRAKDPNAMSNKKAKMKYKKIVYNKPYLHKYIIKCLTTQLAHDQDNLGYMQNFETWINNHTWEKYADINPTKNVGDGRQTRQL